MSQLLRKHDFQLLMNQSNKNNEVTGDLFEHLDILRFRCARHETQGGSEARSVSVRYWWQHTTRDLPLSAFCHTIVIPVFCCCNAILRLVLRQRCNGREVNFPNEIIKLRCFCACPKWFYCSKCFVSLNVTSCNHRNHFETPCIISSWCLCRSYTES
jgi:hypothetical protein